MARYIQPSGTKRGHRPGFQSLQVTSVFCTTDREVSGSPAVFWWVSLLSCGPRRSFVISPETDVVWAAGKEAQGQPE